MPETRDPINVTLTLDNRQVYESLTAEAPTKRGQHLLVEATATQTGARTVEVTIITPGEGSSGIYPAEVLEQAATDKIFAAGTHMHIDHPTATERYEKPERAIQTLAAVLTEDARWTGDALVANARLFEAYADDLLDKSDEIGVSINAYAEVESGKPGEPVTITKFTGVESIDFVTHAGRGGSFRLLESNRKAIQATSERVGEARASEIDAGLRAALKELYAAEDRHYAWLADWDESTVIFEWESPDGSGLYQQTYASDNNTIRLTGTPVEVRKVINYVPIKTEEKQKSEATTEADEPKGKQMPDITQEEFDKAVAEAKAEGQAQAQAEVRMYEAKDAARPAITKALAESKIPTDLHHSVTDDIRGQVTLNESGKLDEDALTKTIESTIKAKEAEGEKWLNTVEAAPAWIVTEHGSTTPADVDALTKLDEKLDAGFAK